MQQAVDNLWRFTGELFQADALEIELSCRASPSTRANCRPNGRRRCTPR
jgi:1,2-phenylacetyl-CoA epoxidase catalytic subunit